MDTATDPTLTAKEAAAQSGSAEQVQEDKAAISPVRYGFAKDKPATLCFEVDLDRIPRAWARGSLVDLDGVVTRWYLEQAKLKAENEKKLHLPGRIPGHSMLRKLFKA